jgi:uncharacterized protein (DUF488 family)
MRIFTIGFTKKSAEAFFSKLKQSGVKRVVDVRLNNVSQLAGFAKRNDLQFFLREICNMDYNHVLELAPTHDLLNRYKKKKVVWSAYEREFLDLMKHREVERTIARDLISDCCLLCSEDKPHYCHRRLVAEYLREKWGNLEIDHIL